MNHSPLTSLNRVEKKFPKRTRRQLASACRATVEFLETRVLMAADTWMNPAGGDWDNAANWSAGIPNAESDVTINTGTLITHNKGSMDFVHSLTSTQPIDFSAGSLNIGTTFTNNAMFTLAGATINGGAITTGTGGSFTLINGVLNNTTLAQAGSNTAALTLTSSGGLLNNITIPAGSMLDATNNANVNVTAGFVLNGTADVGNAAGNAFGRLNFVGSQAISGSGTILMGPYNANYLAISDDSFGDPRLTIGNLITIQAAAGTIGNGSPDNGLQNNGTILATTAGSTLVVTAGESQGITNNGNIECDNGATLTVTQLLTNSVTGELTLNQGEMDISGTGYNNAGRITEAAGILKLGGNFDLLGLGSLSVTGGVVDLTGGLNNTNTTLSLTTATTSSNSQSTFTEPGPWYLDGGEIMGGAIQTASGTSLILTGTGGNFNDIALAGAVIDGTQVGNANVTATGGISGSGQINLGSPTNGNLYARLYFDSSQTLDGVTVNFGVSSANTIFYADNGFGTAATLTIGSGAIIQGLVGGIIAQNSDSKLINDGMIVSSNLGDTISVAAGTTSGSVVNNGIIESQNGGTLTLTQLSTNLNSLAVSGAGSELSVSGTNYNNTNGTFTLAGGTLNIGGSVATSGLGSINATSGTINLTGTLNNTGDTLSLTTAATSSNANGTFSEPGPWNLVGGTILGGAIQTAGGADLVLTGTGGTLNGVSLAGAVIDGTQFGNANTILLNGISGSGQFNLGSPTNSNLYGRLYTQGSQVLGGTVTVNFGISASNAVYSQDLGGTAATLTIGSGAIVEGLVGGILVQSADASIVNDGQIVSTNAGDTFTIAAGTTSGTVVNNGFLNATAGGTLVVTQFSSNTSNISDGNGSSVSLSGTNYVNTGSISISQGTLNLGGTFTLAGLAGAGSFSNTGGPGNDTVNLTGTLTNTGTTLALAIAMTSSHSGSTTTLPGPLNLLGGDIIGGVVSDLPGADLVLTATQGQLNGVTIAAGSLVDGTEVANANAYVVNGLTVNGTVALGSAAMSTNDYGRLFFESGPQTLGGSGLVVIGSNANNAIFVNDSGTPDATLTIGAGLTVQVGAGGIISQSGDTNFVNDGTIIAGVSGEVFLINAGSTSGTVTNAGSIQVNSGATLSITQLASNTATGTLGVTGTNSVLTLSGINYTNTGTISNGGGTLNLGGTVATANLGHLAIPGGLVNLTGTLNNTGVTLNLTASSTSSVSGQTYSEPGPWNLVGGTINGGAVSDSGGANLVLSSTTGVLNNVTVNAGSVIDGSNNSNTDITNGLTLNGTLNLGNAGGTAYGRLFFQGSQILAGTGTINLNSDGNNLIQVNDTTGAPTVIIDPGITIQGAAGTIGGGSSDANLLNGGTINADVSGGKIAVGAGTTSGFFSNSGTLEANTGGTLVISQFAASSGAISVTGAASVVTINGGSGSTFVNSGMISMISGTLNFGGSLTTGLLAGTGTIQITGGTVNITGALNNSGSTLNFATVGTSSHSGSTFTLPGTWRLDGGSISNGAVSDEAGAELTLSGGGGTLMDLTLTAGSVLDGTEVPNANATVTSDGASPGLTVNGEVDLGAAGATSNYGRLFFAGSQTLGGSGNIVFGSDGNNGIFVNDSGSPATLTIAGGVTILGGDGVISPQANDVSIVNQGTIGDSLAGNTLTISAGSTSGTITNLGTLYATNGGTLTVTQLASSSGMMSASIPGSLLSFAGTGFANTGSIGVSAGSLNIGGSTTPAGLGNVSNTGGTINLTGTLTNTGDTLALTNATSSSTVGGTTTFPGPLFLRGGTIVGGAITGSGLTLTGSGGALAAVTIAAGSTLDATQFPNAYTNINGGLFLNGAINLGSPAVGSGNYGRLFFIGSQTLNGTGLITFGTNGNNAMYVQDSSSAATLTISSGITIKGGSGGILAQNSDVSIINNGAINSTGSGNNFSIAAGGTGMFTNSGALSANSGGTLSLNSAVSNVGTINITPGARVAVSGNFAQTAAGNLNLQIAGPPPSTANFGVLAVSGVASLVGNFNVSLVNNYIPVNTNNFTVTTFASSTGSTTFNLPSSAQYAFSKSVNANNIVLTGNGIGDTAPAITNSSTTLNFSVGEMSSYTITTSGTPAPALTESGSLPGGVTFQDNMDGTATISGTPVAGTIGNYSALITAANNVTPNAVKNFTIDVSAAAVAAITSANATTFTVGSAGTFTITTAGFTGTPAIMETGTVPGGLTFTDNGNGTATLSGTPVAADASQATLMITATGGGGSMATQTLSLTIDSAAAFTNGNTASFAVNSPAGFNFTTTGFPAPNLKIMPAPPSGLTFVDNMNGTATLSGRPGTGTGGQYAFTVTATNGVGMAATQTFSLNINQNLAFTSASSATFTAGAANSFTITTSGFPTAAISNSGMLPVGLTLTDNHNGTATLSGTPTVGGTFNISLTASNGVTAGAMQTLALTINQGAAITSANTATFGVGNASSFTITTTGVPAPALLLMPALPSGLTFVDNGNGTATLSGTAAPGTGGQYTFTVTAGNGVGTAATQMQTVTVDQNLAFINGNSAAFMAGAPNTFTIGTTGFPIGAISETGALPAGVSLVDNHDGTATLSGTPTQDGVFNFTIAAGNGVSTGATQSFALTVNEAPVFTSANNFTFAINVPNTFTITTAAYPAPTITGPGNLPSGISFVDNGNGTATIGGTASMSEVGAITLTLSAANGFTPNAQQTVTFTVAAPTIMTSGSNVSVTGTAGQDSSTVTFAGGMVTVSIDGMNTVVPAGSGGSINLNLGSGNSGTMIGTNVPPVIVTGGTGNDTIVTMNGGNTVTGGSGNDSIMAGSGAGGMYKGGSGHDTLVGGGSNTTLVGGSGQAVIAPGHKHESIKGGGGSDTVITSAGHDSIVGGAQGNIFLNGTGAMDSITGGGGINFAEANGSDTMSNIFQLLDPSPTMAAAAAAAEAVEAPALAPAAGTVVTAVDSGGVVNVDGSSLADHIVVSTSGTDLIVKNHGAQIGSFPLAGLTGIVINGKGGADTITVEPNVTLNATLFGGAGADSITAGGGTAVLDGGAGSDTLVGGAATNVLIPGQFQTFTGSTNGKDVLIGGSGFSYADLSYRLDPMFLSNDGKADSGDPYLDEKITIMPSVQGILGGAGSDTIVGTEAGEVLSGGAGNATIKGGGVNDLLIGGLGTDTVRVAAEPVSLSLANGNPDRYTGVNNMDEDVLQLDSEDIAF